MLKLQKIYSTNAEVWHNNIIGVPNLQNGEDSSITEKSQICLNHWLNHNQNRYIHRYRSYRRDS